MASSPPLLLLESSTRNCSVGLCIDGELIALKEEIGEQFIHAEKLHLFAKEILNNSKDFRKLGAVAVSNGPGSYTGLRIGLSLAKGIAFGLNAELITISTLSVLFESYRLKTSLADKTIYWPMLDARRMEVYTNAFDSQRNALQKDRPMILDEELPSTIGICFGNGAEKAQDLLTSKGFQVASGIVPSARSMVHLATEKFQNKEFADKAYSEPFYLKTFQTTPPKKNKT